MVRAFRALQAAAHRNIDVPLAIRKDRLKRLGVLLEQNRSNFEAVISEDFGHRSKHETRFAEAVIVEAAIKHASRHVAQWMAPRRVTTDLHFLPGSNRLVAPPPGVGGIMPARNFSS